MAITLSDQQDSGSIPDLGTKLQTMIHEAISRLSKKYDYRDFTIRCMKGITYIGYVDGAPEWYIKDLLHGLNPEVRRTISEETFLKEYQRIKTVSGINKSIRVKRLLRDMWFPTKPKCIQN